MTLNWRERKALRNLSGVIWENRAQLYTGATTFDSLVRRGFIEEHSSSAGHREPRYCITDAGRAALREPPDMPPTRPKIAILKPRIATMDTRRVKPESKGR